MSDLRKKCIALITEIGLGSADDVGKVEPLTGGVASDIASVELAGRVICIKFALPKLKVQANWEVPVHRNKAEYEWLQVVSNVSPQNGLKLLGHSDQLHGFAMEFIHQSHGSYLWKSELLQGRVREGETRKIGEMLGHIQNCSTSDGFDVLPFQNYDDFHAIRIEPYLNYVGDVHQDLKKKISSFADLLYSSSQVLVHGDISPKNIFFRNDMPIALDAECATMGDASFDPAFCLNHLVLKSFHVPRIRDHLLDEIENFWGAYAKYITWEPMEAVEARIVVLLPMLMLARIDGKSPVEYLSEAHRREIRTLSRTLIQKPLSDLSQLVDELKSTFEEIQS